MRFGCIFPTSEIGNDPMVMRDYAQAAEALGYSHIIGYDHVLGAARADREPPLFGPYDERHAFHEPMTLFGYLAAVTTTIEFMTGVMILPQRQTVLVAKQAAELALLSQGRFRLGVGVGWNHVEYTALGQPFEKRGRLLDEQVEVLQQLWANDVVDFTGEFHRIDRAGLNPRPAAPVPLWFGGFAQPALLRAARHGDGFLFGSADDRSLTSCRSLLELLDETGRRDGFGLDVPIGFGDGADHWHERIDAWQSVGVTSLSMRAMSAATKMMGETDPAFTTPQQHIDSLETFMAAVADRT